MPPVNTRPARPSLRKAIAQLPLPPLPTLTSSTWRTHSSFHSAKSWAFEAPVGEGILDYERLEHVGDALLGAEIALLIDEQYPRLVTGVRSLVKACLVENITLAQISQRLGLPEQILCSHGQGASIRANPGVQACVFEAFLASLHAEQGADALRTFIRAIYSPLLPATVEALRPLFVSVPSTNGINYVGQLMKWSMKKGCPGRSVQFSQSQGSGNLPHNPSWVVECRVSDAASGIGGQAFIGTGTTIAKAKNEWSGRNGVFGSCNRSLNRLSSVCRVSVGPPPFLSRLRSAPLNLGSAFALSVPPGELWRPPGALPRRTPSATQSRDSRCPRFRHLTALLGITHTSFYGARHQPFEADVGEDVFDYERLEHVGEALLGAEVTLLLVKANLVSKEALALISSRLGFPAQLRAAAAQLYQLRNNPIVQASMFEAYLDQLHIEKGHSAFQLFVNSLFPPLVPVVVQAVRAAKPAAPVTPSIGSIKYVGVLMEWTQRTRGRGGRTVTFTPTPSRCGGLAHQPLWELSCTVQQHERQGVTDTREYEGMGSTVGEAKRDAAYQACVDLGLA
ncbi:hypothetical protein JCM10296v2_005356 [Rhodotorula toruloides]